MIKTLGYIGATIALVCALIFVVLRFENPDMTETRLLLTYWKLWVVAVIGIIFWANYYLRNT